MLLKKLRQSQIQKESTVQKVKAVEEIRDHCLHFFYVLLKSIDAAVMGIVVVVLDF